MNHLFKQSLRHCWAAAHQAVRSVAGDNYRNVHDKKRFWCRFPDVRCIEAVEAELKGCGSADDARAHLAALDAPRGIKPAPFAVGVLRGKGAGQSLVLVMLDTERKKKCVASNLVPVVFSLGVDNTWIGLTMPYSNRRGRIYWADTPLPKSGTRAKRGDEGSEELEAAVAEFGVAVKSHDVVAATRAALPELRVEMPLDEHLIAVPVGVLKKAIEDDRGDLREYRKEVFDCDDFSRAFVTGMAIRGITAAGMVVDYSGGHAYNVVITVDVDDVIKLHCLEPQSDEFVNAESGEQYSAKRGYVAW